MVNVNSFLAPVLIPIISILVSTITSSPKSVVAIVGCNLKVEIFKVPFGAVTSLFNRATASLEIGSNTGRFNISRSGLTELVTSYS